MDSLERSPEVGWETVPVPATTRFPIELEPPEGFDPGRLETWPAVEGRLEWVGGRLLYMPPCGDRQAVTIGDLVVALGAWAAARDDFVFGTSDAGFKVGDDVRGADAAVWRRVDVGTVTGGLFRLVPVLAVEVEGRYEREPALRAKAERYLEVGVEVVWILLTRAREVIVLTRDREARVGRGETVPGHASLPGLAPPVDALFRQVLLLGASR
jgi:hypothetical protein